MTNDLHPSIRLARQFLDLMEARELGRAEKLLAPGFIAIYPGDRRFTSLTAVVQASSRRYRHVKKSYVDMFHVPADADGLEAVIFSGTLSGAWADGATFAGIRFTDRFRIRDGLIVEQQVWNDVGEALLPPTGR